MGFTTSRERTHRALESLVENFLALEADPDNRMFACLSRTEFLRECATIRLVTHRAAGHTTAGLRVARRFFRKPVYIGPSLACAKALFRSPQCCPTCGHRDELWGDVGVMSHHSHFDHAMRGRAFDCAIVDVASALRPENEDRLYDALSKMPSMRCVIMLG